MPSIASRAPAALEILAREDQRAVSRLDDRSTQMLTVAVEIDRLLAHHRNRVGAAGASPQPFYLSTRVPQPLAS
jgi:hypothetical protein